MIDQEHLTGALPDYIVEREVGHGGMGVVFLGHHLRLGRAVAIKELPTSFAADPGVRERFSSEARVLATLSHPHIVPIYDYVERDDLCLIVMEQLPGGTVWDRFTTKGLTGPTACAVALACCAALQHAHSKGVLHLDVKPDNLMFASDAAIKVTDFGISRVITGDRTLGTTDGQVLGTPAYMSPEQAKGAELTEASDVYSTAVMLYELLSGSLPWTGAESATDLLLQRLREPPRPLREVASHVPEPLADVVMKGLALEPADRYRHAEEFGVAIASACADSWGPDWLEHAGVAIIGSDRLTMAARTTTRQPAARVATPPRSTSGAGPAPATTVTAAEGEGERAAPETTIGDAVHSPAPATTATPVEHVAAPAPSAPLEFKVVRAEGAAPRIAGADLNRIDRSAFVEVARAIDQPTSTRVPLLIAAVLLVATVALGFALSGRPSSTGSIHPGEIFIDGHDVAHGKMTLDLANDIDIRSKVPRYSAFATKATLRLNVAGIALANLNADMHKGAGTFKTNISRNVVSGAVVGRVELAGGSTVLGHEQFAITAKRPFYESAFGIGALFILLGGFAYLESSLRPLRRARRRVSAFIGLAVSAGVMGVGAFALLSSLGVATLTVAALIVAACGFALSGIAYGVAVRRAAIRKGVRAAVRRAQSSFREAA